MKNTMSKHHETVLAFIKATPNSDFAGIREGNKKITETLLKQIIQQLQDGGNISFNPDDGTYAISAPKKVVASKAEPKAEKKTDKKETAKAEPKAAAAKKNEEESDLGPKHVAGQTGRDNTRYDFGKEKNLSKGRLVLAIIRHHVSENPKISLAKLQEVFKSKEIQKLYGVVDEVSKCKKFTKNKRDRHFLKPEEQIKLNNGNIKVAVCSQFGVESLAPILKIAKDLGYKVTISK
jgi:hypothetical protein